MGEIEGELAGFTLGEDGGGRREKNEELLEVEETCKVWTRGPEER